MPRSNNRGGRNNNPSGRNQYSWGVVEMARERPIAAAVAAAGAAAAGLFLWSKRTQISDQLSTLSDQIGEWRENFRSENQFGEEDDTGDLTTTQLSSTQTTRSQRGMSETGGGNASLGRRSGAGGTRANASSRGRAHEIPSTT